MNITLQWRRIFKAWQLKAETIEGRLINVTPLKLSIKLKDKKKKSRDQEKTPVIYTTKE